MKQCKLFIIILQIMVILIWSTYVSAAMRTALSCSYSDVQTAYTAASNGDTVSIPSCAETNWSTNKITIAKTNLTIQGQGVGNTILKGTDQLFAIAATSTNNVRITGIEFHGCSQCLYFDKSSGEGTKNLRVDHNQFSNGFGQAMQFQGHATGVVDNNTFVDGSPGISMVLVYGSNDLTKTFPFSLGTSDAVFFEDNTITARAGTASNHFIASNSGSKYVLRYNTFDYAQSLWNPLDAHGYCEVQGRGSFTWEIYNNKFSMVSGLDKIVNLRGGQGVIFNNNISNNASWPIVLTDYRTCSPPCVTAQNGITDIINNSYFWNNKRNCGSDLTNCAGGSTFNPTNDCSSVITLNTNYFNSAMGGYTPYTYPHPLVAPYPPQNLRIGQ